MFCRRRRTSPIRYGEHYTREQNEQLFLDFVIQCGVIDKRAAGTVKTRVLAVRALHFALGLPDPLANCPRTWQAIEGLKRRQGQRA